MGGGQPGEASRVGRDGYGQAQIYQSVIAQIALRTLREIFASTPKDMISTVVFNGRVHDIDPLTGQKIQPHLITWRATREVLDDEDRQDTSERRVRGAERRADVMHAEHRAGLVASVRIFTHAVLA